MQNLTPAQVWCSALWAVEEFMSLGRSTSSWQNWLLGNWMIINIHSKHWRNFDPFFFAKLLQFAGGHLHKTLLCSRYNILRLRSGLLMSWRNLILFVYVFLLVGFIARVRVRVQGRVGIRIRTHQWLSSLSFYITHIGPQILWYTEVDSIPVWYPGPVTAKQSQVITSPSTCLTFGERGLCQYAWFKKSLYHGQTFKFCLIYPKTIVPKENVSEWSHAPIFS